MRSQVFSGTLRVIIQVVLLIFQVNNVVNDMVINDLGNDNLVWRILILVSLLYRSLQLSTQPRPPW